MEPEWLERSRNALEGPEWPEMTEEELERAGKTGMAGDGWEEPEWLERSRNALEGPGIRAQ